MNNRAAAAKIRETLEWLGAASRPEQEIFDYLRQVSIEWSSYAELSVVMTIIAGGWLEDAPQSSLARRLLVQHLARLGYLQEAREIEAGAPPRIVSIVSGIEERTIRLLSTVGPGVDPP